MSTNALIGLGITAVATAVVGAARFVIRERTIENGQDARATILHVQTVESRGPVNQPYLLLQVAIPRGDGTEIVAEARAGYWLINKMPEPGWTVPVYYRQRPGGKTLVEIMAPPSRPAKADS